MPSGSFQKPTGIDGMGSVITSSPTSPTRDVPSGENESTAQPTIRHGITPARTGSDGAPPTNAVHTSVPPDSDDSATSDFTAS